MYLTVHIITESTPDNKLEHNIILLNIFKINTYNLYCKCIINTSVHILHIYTVLSINIVHLF